MIIVDTDVLSTFAKIERIKLLKELFSGEVYITPMIREEISVPLEYGYNFPNNVISSIETVTIDEEVLERYQKYSKETSLGKGEIEAIAYCEIKDWAFVTNDLNARQFAKKRKIRVLSLQAVLKALWKKELLSKESVEILLEEIIEKDNLAINKETRKYIFDE